LTAEGLIFHISTYIGGDLSNPFEDESGDFIVLMNAEEQFSLWPAFRDPPAGWVVVRPAAKRQTCVDWIEEHSTNMRRVGSFRA
jgi:MbtH protein